MHHLQTRNAATYDSQESIVLRINSLSQGPQSSLATLAQIASTGRTVATTAEAAHALGFQPQTLRRWACYGTYPSGISPIRISGRLRWKISEILDLLEGGTK